MASCKVRLLWRALKCSIRALVMCIAPAIGNEELQPGSANIIAHKEHHNQNQRIFYEEISKRFYLFCWMRRDQSLHYWKKWWGNFCQGSMALPVAIAVMAPSNTVSLPQSHSLQRFQFDSRCTALVMVEKNCSPALSRSQNQRAVSEDQFSVNFRTDIFALHRGKLAQKQCSKLVTKNLMSKEALLFNLYKTLVWTHLQPPACPVSGGIWSHLHNQVTFLF